MSAAVKIEQVELRVVDTVTVVEELVTKLLNDDHDMMALASVGVVSPGEGAAN